MRPAGVSRGQDTHVGTSAFRVRWAREDGGWDGAARRAPRLACLPADHFATQPLLAGPAAAR